MITLHNYHAGDYRQQYQYRSFQPTTINHPWEIADGEVLTLLSEADLALGELRAYGRLIPDVDLFIRMHIAREATTSSRIEGTRTNIEEALLSEADVNPEKRDDWQEVRNYVDAVNQAITELATLPLSNRLLKHTHATLMRGVRGERKAPGEFRTSQNWIGVSLKNAVFVPPHQNDVAELMSDLELFFHNEQLHIPHLLKIAIAHYQFETIHPFLDGNGRLGRLMIVLYLVGFGLLDKPALYLSDYFERHRTEYVDHLMAVREGNHLRAWLMFFLDGVRESAESAARVFREILALKSRIELEVLPRFTTRRQSNVQSLMHLLWQQPIVDIAVVRTTFQLNHNTAAALIRDLEQHGVLREITGNRRNRLYLFDEYMRMFQR